jgi:hypothetical protein
MRVRDGLTNQLSDEELCFIAYIAVYFVNISPPYSDIVCKPSK